MSLVSALLDRLPQVKPKVLFIGASLFLLLVILLGYVLFSGGPEEPPAPVPVLFDESEVAGRVEATVAAMEPTPTPTPLPDIAATLQAQLFPGKGERLVLNPLDSAGERNPYLNAEELDYLAGLGDRLWAHTGAWLHLRQVLFPGPGEWSPQAAEPDVAQARELLDSVPERGASPSSQVGEVVSAYGRTVEEGMSRVRAAVSLLESAVLLASTAKEEPLTPEDQEKLRQIFRDAQDSLEAFNRAMSAYGCSICGELFRLGEPEK